MRLPLQTTAFSLTAWSSLLQTALIFLTSTKRKPLRVQLTASAGTINETEDLSVTEYIIGQATGSWTLHRGFRCFLEQWKIGANLTVLFLKLSDKKTRTVFPCVMKVRKEPLKAPFLMQSDEGTEETERYCAAERLTVQATELQTLTKCTLRNRRYQTVGACRIPLNPENAGGFSVAGNIPGTAA